MRNKKEDEKREDEMEVQGVTRLGGTGRALGQMARRGGEKEAQDVPSGNKRGGWGGERPVGAGDRASGLM